MQFKVDYFEEIRPQSVEGIESLSLIHIYPEGKIVKTIRSITEKMAIVEAKVYLSKNDPEDSYVANAFAQKYRMDDSEIGQKYVELAETAAVGRALSDAGFGLQLSLIHI